MSLSSWAALVVALVGVVVVVRLQVRHTAAVRRDRAALFDSALEVLDGARVEPRDMDFPLLHGTFDGRPVRVEPLVDTLSLRLVPVLRLVVTLRADLPGQAAVSVLADESGQEFFSGHRDLPRLRDDRWPARISVAGSVSEVRQEQADALVDLVARDDTVKQLLVREHGVRCVVRAGQADTTTYRVTRRVDLAGVRVEPAVLRDAVRLATAVWEQSYASDPAPEVV